MTSEDIKKIIQEKVIGVWEPNHDNNGHRYVNKQTGHIQRSVTTKLGILAKEHLINWAVRQGAFWLIEDVSRGKRLYQDEWQQAMINGMQLAHTDTKNFAGSTGSKTHWICERYLNQWLTDGKRPESIMSFVGTNDTPEAIAGARGFEKFCIENPDFEPIASEIIVGHPLYSAGAIDIIGIWKGKLCLLDIKTSNSVDKNFRYQLSAYKYMFEFMTSLKIKHVKIIHLSKDMAKYEIYNVKELVKAWKTFKHICAVYDDVMSYKEKISKDIKKIRI